MKTGQKFFGMTLGQIGILAILALIACILIGVFGSLLLSSIPDTQQIEPTYTLQPSPTPFITATAWPTITPIPNWQEFVFAEDQAKIWLSASYIGGDTASSPEYIMERLRATFNDEAFANDIQELLAKPEIVFFGFDAESTASSKFMYVGKEPLDPDTPLSMDTYLNRMMDNFTGGNDRVIERQIVQLDHYPAGKLVVESKVPAGEVEMFVTMAIYMIEVDETMWIVTYRTGRDEYKDYQQTIETSMNSFWAER